MKNLLIVDDNQDIAKLLKVILELSGYSVLTANSGRECLNLLSNNKFDLISLDIAMPDITGVDVLKKIKADHTLAHNKVVFITASSPTDTVMEGLMKEGALEVVKKPITEEKLVEVVTKYA